MATYITLSRWTQKGAEHLKESPARLDKVKEAAKAAGGELKNFYLTMGEYDFVIVWEFPDDKACAKFAMGVMAQGNVSSKTLKTFSESEYREIMGSL
jgi:uncharacterized protein with GYD domain